MPNQPTPTPTVKHHFVTAAIAAGIILVVALFIWIPFKLIPALFSTGSNFVATSLSSTFIPATSSSQTAGNENTASTQPNTSATAHTAYTGSYQASYYGHADLAVTFIASGIIDPGTKHFMQTGYAGQNDLVAIKFQVANIGTNVSGPWTLRLNMPSRTTPYYDSNYQPSIKPGDRMEFVASFDTPITQGINTAYITADPLNMIAENNEGNNQLIVPLNISGTSYSYNTNYNYGTAYYNPAPYGTLYSWTNIGVSCYANPQTSYLGNTITWTATATGGNGYFTYSWAGSDGLTGTDMIENKQYFTSGMKTAVVTVTSNGQSVSKACNVYIY